jgi:hypothetical protein
MSALLRSLSVVLTLVMVAACGGSSEPLEPTATYDAVGATITPDEAVAAAAVLADPSQYLDKEVKIEGAVTEVCQNAGCWLTMGVSDGVMLRVDVPRDSAGAYVYTFPKDIAGRRIVVAGVLKQGADAAHEHGEHETQDATPADSSAAAAHDEAESAAMTVNLALVADGALIERVRVETETETESTEGVEN